MEVPKYIINMMERASFDYDNAKGSPGYTINITKWGHYERISTFREEIEKLISWVDNNCGYDVEEFNEPCAKLLYIPTETKFKRMQYATVTIFDPVMKYLEKYISKNPKFVLV